MRGLSIDSRYRVVRNYVPDPGVRAATPQWRTRGGSITTPETTRTVESVGWTESGKALKYVNVSDNYQFIQSSPIYTAIVQPVVPGRAIFGSIRACAGRDIQVRLQFRVRNQAGIATDLFGPDINIGSTPRDVTGMIIVPESAVNVEFALLYASSATPFDPGDWFMAGQALLSDSEIDYHDGDSLGWIWDGTPGASTSRGLVFVP